MALRRKRVPESEYARLAAEHRLARLNERPGILGYIASTWAVRGFATHLAKAKAYGRHQNTYLGQLWLILNPLLLAAVYYLVFGVLLGTQGGVENYIGFLVIGIFVFTYIANIMSAGGSAITGNLAIIRAMHFPRSGLPLSVVLAESIAFLPALGIMIVLTLLSGEIPQWQWLLAIPAFLLTAVFGLGVALIVARAVQFMRDLRNVIPLLTRVLRYTSGVFFSISHYAGGGALGLVLEYQPVAVYLTMFRSSMLAEFSTDPTIWSAGVAWAFGTLLLGTLFFWQAEDQYGRN